MSAPTVNRGPPDNRSSRKTPAGEFRMTVGAESSSITGIARGTLGASEGGRMKTRLRLTPADKGRPLSLEEFLDSEQEEGARYELIEGRLEVSPLPELTHEELSEWLVEVLRTYARACPSAINKVKAPARVFVPNGDDEVTAPEPD